MTNTDTPPVEKWLLRSSYAAVLLAALVGGLTDLGYFIFLDLGGFVKFVPGTLMTLVSSAAIITGFWAYFISKSTGRTGS